MKKLLILLTVFISLSSITYSGSTYSGVPDSLVGVWQDSDVLASGWSNSFLFFKDGNYSFFVNQMDCSKRLLSYSGKWKIDGDVMILTITQRVIVIGGEMVKSDGSCASDSNLVGGTEKTVKVKPKEKMEYAVSKIYTDNSSGDNRKYVYIDAMKYWYYGDPVQMRIQFEGE